MHNPPHVSLEALDSSSDTCHMVLSVFSSSLQRTLHSFIVKNMLTHKHVEILTMLGTIDVVNSICHSLDAWQQFTSSSFLYCPCCPIVQMSWSEQSPRPSSGTLNDSAASCHENNTFVNYFSIMKICANWLHRDDSPCTSIIACGSCCGT